MKTKRRDVQYVEQNGTFSSGNVSWIPNQNFFKMNWNSVERMDTTSYIRPQKWLEIIKNCQSYYTLMPFFQVLKTSLRLTVFCEN